jgi:hypothetical protein
MFACERSNALVTSPNEVAANASWADTVIEYDDDQLQEDVVDDVLTAADAVLDTAAEVATEVATAAATATAAAASTAAAAVGVPPDNHVQA